MAIADTDPAAALAKGQAKVAARALTASTAEAPQALPPVADVPPSVQAAQVRQATRARQATVTRWLRQLSAPRP